MFFLLSHDLTLQFIRFLRWFQLEVFGKINFDIWFILCHRTLLTTLRSTKIIAIRKSERSGKGIASSRNLSKFQFFIATILFRATEENKRRNNEVYLCQRHWMDVSSGGNMCSTSTVGLCGLLGYFKFLVGARSVLRNKNKSHFNRFGFSSSSDLFFFCLFLTEIDFSL